MAGGDPGQDPVASGPASAIGRRKWLEALMGLVRALALTGELARARQYGARRCGLRPSWPIRCSSPRW